MDLHGKVAIVTGAGRGLGLAYARSLAAAGAKVVVNDVDADTAAAAAAEVGGTPLAAPVGSTQTAQALVAAAVEAYGRLDILVTNAGVLRDAMLWKMTDDDFDQVIAVHLRGTFTCVRAAAVRMREQGEGGRIICVGSPTGQLGNIGQTNYAAAKAGIVGMVRTWAMELARAQITVNALIPVAATAMTATVAFLKPYVEALEAGQEIPAAIRHDLGFGTPEDVAGVVTFLASDAAAGVTGQAIGIGGDRLALWSHPAEVAVQHLSGGWDPDAIAEIWPTAFAPHQQQVGQQAPGPQPPGSQPAGPPTAAR
jgi:NAD(P)-dependent dehydrogenase (short-subunit alcohol dehydrogenase family)